MSQKPQTPDNQLTNIFINYRRADTSGHAGRLERELSNRFPGRVFMDIHNIEVGKDFTEAINDEVGKCGALIVMIGNQWLSITDSKTGKRRLDNPDDFVALEIARALNRNISVIPVLVEGATMPQQEDLPLALAGLVRRNALEITDIRWDYDVERLSKVLEKSCGGTPPPPTKPGRGLIALISVVAALIASVTLIIYLRSCENTGNQNNSNVVAPTGSPQPSVVATATTPAPSPTADTHSSNELQGRAKVDLSKHTAEFVFFFDTRDKEWEFYHPDSKPRELEYSWDIHVKDEGNDIEYKITVYVPNENLEKARVTKQNFYALLAHPYKGIQTKKGDAGWGTIDKKCYCFEGFAKYKPEADKFRIVITGKKVEDIFASRPDEVNFEIKKLDHIKADDLPVTSLPVCVEYDGVPCDTTPLNNA